MSFREKSAWISFVTVLLAAGVFFGARFLGELRPHQILSLMIATVVGLVVLQVVLHAIAAMMNPADARSPKDERERAIQLRSHSVGYYVLVAGVIALFVTGHISSSAHALMFHVLIALVISTLSISLTQIVLFRLSR